MQDIFSSINPATTVITGTSRLARHLTERFDRWQIEQGHDVWDTPTMVPWNVFVDDAYARWVTPGSDEALSWILLRPSQEQVLWEQIIERSLQGKSDEGLYQIPATARAASAAYRLALNWGLDPQQIDEDGSGMRVSDDVDQFKQWVVEFRNTCQQKNLLPLAEAGEQVLAWCQSNRPPDLERLFYAGFDQVTPHQRKIMQALESQGVAVSALEHTAQRASASRVSFTSAREESLYAARWARKILENDNTARIGIVTPDLEAVRSFVSRDLADALDSANDEPHAAGRSNLFHLSLGAPLADAPVIYAGLTALRLIDDPMDVDDVGLILRSPFFKGGEAECDGRARLDIALRRDGQESVTLANLRWLTTEREATARFAPEFGVLLGELGKSRETFDLNPGTRQSASEWAELFTAWLAAIGWGAGRELSSEEFQAREAWHDLVSDFCSLDLVMAPLSLSAAVAQLSRLAQERIHQPRSRAAPVEVMGVIESGGLNFTHLWLMGMTDTVWPPAARPNPFIPVTVQRNAGVAESDPNASLGHARDVTERLLSSAPEVVVSHALADVETQLRASPLLTDLPAVSVEGLGIDQAVDRISQLVAAPAKLDVIQDHQGPALSGDVAGGTGIFKDQSHCPFKAFAVHRLGATAPADISSGVDAIERGQLVHEVMDVLFKAVGSSDALAQLDEDAIRSVIRESVVAGVERRATLQKLIYTPAVKEIETDRLEKIAFDWMLIERDRPGFNVVSIEDDRRATVAGIDISLRIDRVDELAAGGKVIMDYKTGQVDVKDWASMRPSDPQLLVYAQALGVEGVDTITFAKVRVGESQFAGLSREPSGVDGIKTIEELKNNTVIKKEGYNSLGEMLAVTGGIVERLGREFREGQARVDPLPNACTWCPITPLCRVKMIDVDDLQVVEGGDVTD